MEIMFSDNRRPIDLIYLPSIYIIPNVDYKS